MKHTKLLTLAIAALFAGSAMAETETHPSSASSNTDIKGTSYTLSGTYIAGQGGTKAGTMTSKGIKFRINKPYNETNNAVPFIVNDGYKITNISFNGQVNDNSKTSVLSQILVDNTAIAFTAVTLPAKTSSIEFSTGTIGAKKSVVLVFDGDASQANIEYTITYEAAQIATDDATLKSISIDGEPIADFASETTTYNVELPFGTTVVPTVTATPTSKKANAEVTHATALPGTTTITVTAEDNKTTKQYQINFTVKAEASHDASVSSITLKGLTINSPKTDTIYSLTYEYLTTIPTESDLTVTLNDENAQVSAVDNFTEWGKVYTITTVAQDGTTTNTYKIQLFCDGAPKHLYEVLFSNGAKGAINEQDTVITVPYLAGEAVPTTTVADIKTDSTMIAEIYRKCTATIDTEGNIIVTGEDNTTLKFPVKGYELTAPTTLGTDTVKFDGTEISYIYGAYGYDTSKGWKFAKKVNDSNRRISKGTTRLYMAIPAADSLTLISSVQTRAIKLYVNGVENTEVTETGAAGEGMKFKLDATKTNFICIESNQTSGDGGFSALILTPAKATPSAIDNAATEVKAVKVIRNGQLYILKGDKIYTALGTIVE